MLVYSHGQKFWQWHTFCVLQTLLLQYFYIIFPHFYGILKNNDKHIELKSWELPGHGSKIEMQWSSSHFFITLALWHGASSCWKMHRLSPNFLWIVGRSRSCRTFWYHSLFMAMFLGRIMREPTPLVEKQPHTWIKCAADMISQLMIAGNFV